MIPCFMSEMLIYMYFIVTLMNYYFNYCIINETINVSFFLLFIFKFISYQNTSFYPSLSHQNPYDALERLAVIYNIQNLQQINKLFYRLHALSNEH